MMHSQSRRGDRHSGLILDVIHLVIGILIVVLGFLSFLNPEKYQLLFPLIFFLAGGLNGVSGVFALKTPGRDKKKFRAGLLHMLAALLLTALGVLSAVSIWG